MIGRSDINSVLIVKMVGSKIKFFHFFQKCHRILGIDPCQFNQKKRQRSTNSRKTIFLISYSQLIIGMMTYICFETKSLFDYGFVCFIVISIFASTAIYLIFIWQSQNTGKFIKNCEIFIEKSEYRSETVWNYSSLSFVFFSIFFLFLFY